MDAALGSLLSSLHAAGVTHDAAEPDRLRRLRNLGPALAVRSTTCSRTPDEVADVLPLVAADAAFVAETIPVGNGLYLAWRRPLTAVAGAAGRPAAAPGSA